MRAYAVTCLLFAAVPAPECEAAEPATPFTSRRPGEVAVPVVIGDRGPFRFLLDTGSTHSAVTAAVTRQVGARAVALAPVGASGGIVQCVVVALRAVSVGPAAVDELTASELPEVAGEALGPDVDGILGQDFLARFSFTIDYTRSRVRWHGRGAGEHPRATGLRLALVPSQDRFVVELSQPGQGRALRLVPDSAADTLVLYDAPAVSGLVGAWTPGRAVLASPTGARPVRVGLVDGLRVGEATLDRQPAVVLPARPSGAGPGPDGLLPLHLFASVSFNARERSLVIQPR